MSQAVSVLTLLKSCCYRWNIPFPAAGTIYGNNDPGARQLLHILYAVCEELRQAACWTQQKRTFTFDTVSGQSNYLMPQDFYCISPFTEWNDDQTRRLIGPLPDSDFSARLNGAVGGVQTEYRLFGWDTNQYSAGGQFQVYPTPTDAQTLSFEYLTSNLLLPRYWSPSTAYTITTSWVTSANNIYQCSQSGTSHASTAPTAVTQGFTDGTAKWNYISQEYIEITSDNDILLFDEALIKLGIRAKWRDEKGEESDKAEAEFKSKIDAAVAQLKPASIGSFSRMGRSRVRPRGDRDGGYFL